MKTAIDILLLVILVYGTWTGYKRGLIMGKLYKRNGEWKFAAIGDAFEDKSIINTIIRVIKDYSK